mgnify:FL=1
MTKLENDILNIIKSDSRHTSQEIAVMLGVDEKKVKETIKAIS